MSAWKKQDDLLVDQRVESFTEHLLLLLGRSSGQRLGRESRSGGSGGLLTGVLRSDGHLSTSGSVGRETLGNTDGRRSTVDSRTGSAIRGSGTSVVGRHTVRTGRGHTIRHGGHTGSTVRSVSGSVLHHLRSTGVSTHHGSHGHHTGLTVSGHGRVAVYGLTHVSGSTHTVESHSRLSLVDLRLESLSSNILSLGESDIQRLGANHLAVHLGYSLGSLVGGRVADETKVLGSTLVILHDSAAGDCSEWVKLGSESLIVPLVIEVLDVEVDTGRLGLLLVSSFLVSLFELVVSLGSLLGSSSVKLLSLEVLVVQLVNGLGGGFMVDIVDETETKVSEERKGGRTPWFCHLRPCRERPRRSLRKA
jgi:hypothetical protein